METQFWLEMVGYLGSVLVAISLTMRSLLRLRIINLVGALVFVIYGFVIGAYPVALLNSLIVGIDLYYLVQMIRQKDFFTLLEISEDSAYLRGFVEFYKKEIAEIFPDFSYNPQSGQIALLVLRNMVPAGVILLQLEGEQGRVLLDYVIPGYRDFGVAKFLFVDNSAYFSQRGIKRLVTSVRRLRHVRYLERMGFRLEGDNYVRDLGGAVMKDASL